MCSSFRCLRKACVHLHQQDVLEYCEDMSLTNTVSSAIQKLEIYLHSTDYKGYDKYSLLSMPFPLMLLRWQSILGKIARKPYFVSAKYFPDFWLRVLQPPRLAHAKAMGLIAEGYLNLFTIYEDEVYQKRSQNCLQWLLENTSSGYPQYCWGVPFDWQSSSNRVPANTPIASVSSICADAFWRWGNMFEDENSRQVVRMIVDALSHSLYRHPGLGADRACYGYTAVDKAWVINGNLFLAEKMMLIGKTYDNSDMIDESLRIVRYCLENVNPDGTFYYQGAEAGKSGHVIDSYHTGFVLRSIDRIHSLHPSEELEDCLKRGVDAYIRLFVGPNGETWMFPNDRLVDIHGCAETIICFGRLKERFPYLDIYWKQAIEWTIAHMQDSRSGHFYYQQWRILNGTWTIRTPYVRWSQAWMFKALSEALILANGKKVGW